MKKIATSMLLAATLVTVGGQQASAATVGYSGGPVLVSCTQVVNGAIICTQTVYPTGPIAVRHGHHKYHKSVGVTPG